MGHVHIEPCCLLCRLIMHEEDVGLTATLFKVRPRGRIMVLIYDEDILVDLGDQLEGLRFIGSSINFYHAHLLLRVSMTLKRT